MLPRPLALLALALAGCAAQTPPPPAAPPPAPKAAPAERATWRPGQLDPERKARFAALEPDLDKLFTADLEARHYPGIAVGIVIDGELVYAKGFGYRDVARKLPFDADTRFPIASVTKGFTAMAILKLRDEGKLGLDDPAERYYPPLASLAYPTRDAPKVTVRHLLTHASGLPEDNPWADVNDGLGQAELTRMVEAGLSFSRAPGVRFEYSNVAYAVLGRVIEGASGMPMREYVRREILTPLGMTSSGWEAEEFPEGSVAVGYRGEEGSHDPAAPAVIAPIHKLGTMDSAGGLFTSIRDLGRYVAFQLDAWPPRDAPEAGPLDRSSVREMQQGMRRSEWSGMVPALLQRRPPPTAWSADEGLSLNASAYGFGLMAVTTCEDDFQVVHGGGLPGHVTALMMLPERGFGIIAFVNDERFGPRSVIEATRLLRKAGMMPIRKAEPAPALVDTRTGVHDLVKTWDDARVKELFEPTVFRYYAVETLKQRLAQLAKDHGECRFEGELRVVNRLRGTWREVCERGAVTFVAALSPEAKPRLQSLEWREEVPPGKALETAAAAVMRLAEKWDPKVAAEVFAPSVDAARMRKVLGRIALEHGACKVGRAVESDGKESATFLLTCAEGELEISVAVEEKSGKVTRVEGHSAMDPERPNCAE